MTEPTNPEAPGFRQAADRRSRLVRVAIGASFCLLLAACGSDGDGDTDASAESNVDVDATLTTMVIETETTIRSLVTADGETEGTLASTTTTSNPVTTTTGFGGVAGEPLDFGPTAGAGLAIVGVAYDDVLNFRSDPAPGAEILASYGPLSDDLDTFAMGEAWAAPSGVWWKVNVVGTESWANQAFLGGLGSSFNAFDEVAAELGILTFDSVETAALAVAEIRSSVEPQSRIVFSGEPLAFDAVGFAIVDVMDLGDDSVKGERIRVDVEVVFDEQSGDEGAQDVAFVVLTNVEITPICGRGVSGGLCS